jgi:hypothetical protein
MNGKFIIKSEVRREKQGIPKVKTGPMEIEVLTSKELREAPVLSFTPQGGLPIRVPLTGKGKVWRGIAYIESTTPEGIARFSFKGVGMDGQVGTLIKEGESFEIDTTIYAKYGGIVSNKDGTKVEVPPQALSIDINIQVIPENIESISGSPFIKILPTTARRFIAVEDGTKNIIKYFKKDLLLSIPYPDEDQDGVVDGTGIKEEGLVALYYDSTKSKWMHIPNSKSCPSLNILSFRTRHLSTFVLASVDPVTDMDNIIGYPNPCYPDEGQRLYIDYIPKGSNPVVYIYNVAGELVRVLDEEEEIVSLPDRKRAIWDAKNDYGNEVAYGVYIYIVKCRMGVKIGKIAIIR